MARECVASATVPSEVTSAENTTCPMQEAMRCIATGRPMRRQGSMASLSGRSEQPLGDTMRLLRSAMNIAMPPAV